MQRDQILANANACVSHDRAAAYGSAEQNYGTVAGLWQTYLQSIPRGRLLDAADVCNMMALMKMGRALNSPQHADHYVDACGYLALAGEITRAK